MVPFETLSIFLGAMDETESIRKTVESIMENCDRGDLGKIILVTSPKSTPDCISAVRTLEERYPGAIHAFQQVRPSLGGFVNDAIDAAESSHVMLFPSDLAFDLDCIPRMIEAAKQNPGKLIATSRWLKKGSFHGYDRTKYVFNFLAQKFLRILFGGNVTDYTNPTMIVPTKFYQSVAWETTEFSFMVEMKLKPLRMGFEVVEIPTNCYERTEGKSGNSFWKTASYFKASLHIRFLPKDKILLPDSEWEKLTKCSLV